MRRLLCTLAALTGCAEAAPNAIHVVATDYAFAVPDTLPAGPAIFSLESKGKKPHEMILLRIRDNVSSAEMGDSIAHARATRPLRATGSAVLFASAEDPTNAVTIGVTLERGKRYALLCQFRDTSGAPRHMQLGMYKLLTVR